MFNPYNPYQNQYGQFGFAQQPQQAIKPVQPLTQDEINHLRNKVNDMINVSLTEDEILKAKCTHKDKNGQMTLFPLNPNAPENGDVYCEICGATFNVNPINDETCENAIAVIKNVLQQTKTLWTDIPVSVATDYMVVEPLLGKTMKFYKVASEHFNRANNGTTIQQMGMNNGYAYGNPFDAANALANGMPYYYGGPQGPMGYQQPMGPQPVYGQQAPQGAPVGYQQPMYPQQPVAPMGYQQPMYNQPQYQAPMPGVGMGGNPFGVEVTQPPAAQPVVAPQATAPVAQPVVAAAPADAANTAVKVQKAFNI